MVVLCFIGTQREQKGLHVVWNASWRKAELGSVNSKRSEPCCVVPHKSVPLTVIPPGLDSVQGLEAECCPGAVLLRRVT